MSIYNIDNIDALVADLYLPLRQKQNTKHKKKKVIVIAGPTAVGKTKLSLSIAKILSGEIISSDSMQVYKEMDVGTAKVSKEERKIVKHHLIDIKEISESFNVSDYFREAHRAIRDVLSEGKVPIVVGGSGFYIHALLYGPPMGPPSNVEIRKDLEEKLKKFGAEFLYEKLELLDPEYAKTITNRDRHKIIRSLEIITITQKKVSDIPKPKMDQNLLYNYRLWFLSQPRVDLYLKVEKRCDEMIKNGFIQEVEKLEKKGLRDNYSVSQAIGYRQCLEYLDSKRSAEDKIKFVSDFKRASKKYVKRQFTWFKKEANFRWLHLNEIGFERAKEYILQDYEQSM